MEYYLYTHYNADGIFYVGKGTKDRSKSRYLGARSKEWHDISKKGYLTKIEATGTEKSIFSLERLYIKTLANQGVHIVNKVHNPNWLPHDYDFTNLTESQIKRKKERIKYWRSKV